MKRQRLGCDKPVQPEPAVVSQLMALNSVSNKILPRYISHQQRNISSDLFQFKF